MTNHHPVAIPCSEHHAIMPINLNTGHIVWEVFDGIWATSTSTWGIFDSTNFCFTWGPSNSLRVCPGGNYLTSDRRCTYGWLSKRREFEPYLTLFVLILYYLPVFNLFKFLSHSTIFSIILKVL